MRLLLSKFVLTENPKMITFFSNIFPVFGSFEIYNLNDALVHTIDLMGTKKGMAHINKHYHLLGIYIEFCRELGFHKHYNRLIDLNFEILHYNLERPTFMNSLIFLIYGTNSYPADPSFKKKNMEEFLSIFPNLKVEELPKIYQVLKHASKETEDLQFIW